MTNTFKPKIIIYHFYSGNTLERYIEDENEWEKVEAQAIRKSPPDLKFVDSDGYNVSGNIKDVEFMRWEDNDES